LQRARNVAHFVAFRNDAGVPSFDPDLVLRQAAVSHARQLAFAYDDLVPLTRLREGFSSVAGAFRSVRFSEGFTVAVSNVGRPRSR
jgi:hypothetical protein